jgi:O-antigen ligase
MFWRSISGLFYLIPLLPLQTIRYRMNQYPLGGSVVGIILVAVAIGILREHKPLFPKTPWTKLIIVYSVYLFISLLIGTAFLSAPLPLPGDPRFGYWQEYMAMPALLLFVAATKPNRKQMKIIIVLMCFAVLLLNKSFWNTVSGRDYSAFSWDLREGGSMGYAGTNGLAAFESQFAALLVALAAFEKKRLWKLGYLSLGVFSLVCLVYSLSRGGYVAALVGWAFLGLFKQRKLLPLLVAFLLTWTTLVPLAVQERVFMTYDEQNQTLDHSAETRLKLWDDAVDMITSSPVVGTGFNTYAYLHRVGTYEDTHNYYLKVMVETGAVGLLMFLLLVVSLFWTGLRFSWKAKDPFFASLGLGLAAWVLCSASANCFGDRWTYLQVNGYLWVLGGLVARSRQIESEPESEPKTESGQLTAEPAAFHADLVPA